MSRDDGSTAGYANDYARVAGIPDPETGFSVGLDALDRLLREEVTGRLDSRNLNHDVPGGRKAD